MSDPRERAKARAARKFKKSKIGSYPLAIYNSLLWKVMINIFE